jgi:hypothetical protein
MSYTTALASFQPGPGTNNDSLGMLYEDVSVTGSGDTSGTYVTNFVKQPIRALGGFFVVTFSGQTATISSAALTGTEYLRIIGFG